MKIQDFEIRQALKRRGNRPDNLIGIQCHVSQCGQASHLWWNSTRDPIRVDKEDLQSAEASNVGGNASTEHIVIQIDTIQTDCVVDFLWNGTSDFVVVEVDTLKELEASKRTRNGSVNPSVTIEIQFFDELQKSKLFWKSSNEIVFIYTIRREQVRIMIVQGIVVDRRVCTSRLTDRDQINSVATICA